MNTDFPAPDDPPEPVESPEHTLENDISHLLRKVYRTLNSIGPLHPEYAALREAADNLSIWFEQTDDPVQNGWVNSQGRP